MDVASKLHPGLRIASLSADSEDQTRLTQAACSVSFPLLYGLDIAAMKRLGLYISEPISVEETDHIYSEPALLVVNSGGGAAGSGVDQRSVPAPGHGHDARRIQSDDRERGGGSWNASLRFRAGV